MNHKIKITIEIDGEKYIYSCDFEVGNETPIADINQVGALPANITMEILKRKLKIGTPFKEYDFVDKLKV